MANKRHVWLSVACIREGEHADFRIENGHFICNVCGGDFTIEVEEVYMMLKSQLNQTTNDMGVEKGVTKSEG